MKCKICLHPESVHTSRTRAVIGQQFESRSFIGGDNFIARDAVQTLAVDFWQNFYRCLLLNFTEMAYFVKLASP